MIMIKPNFETFPPLPFQAPRWVLWKEETRHGKLTKVPYQITGRLADVSDPSTWTDLPNVRAAYEAGGYSGAGFMLSATDSIVGLDLDKCLDLETGELEPWAADIVVALPTYCEVSPSGRGLRLFGFGTLPPGGRKKGRFEMYEAVRYFTVTGKRFNDHTDLREITAELAQFHARIFKPRASPPVDSKPRPVSHPTLDDASLLDKARVARNGGEFDALWRGDTSNYGGDDSSADLALCNLLAFWTGNDPARIDRLFRQSGLMREKWDARRGDSTYGQMTIAKALEAPRDTYLPSSRGTPIPPESPSIADNILDFESGKMRIKKSKANNDKGETHRPKQADALISMALELCEFWHDPQGEPYATEKGSTPASYLINGTAFRRWLSHKTFKNTGSSPGNTAMQEALTTLSGLAQFEGPSYPAFLRIGRYQDSIYIDLANERWNAIEIDGDGWRLVERPPVRFVRSKAMRALPEPVPGGTIADLWEVLNVNEQDRPLIYGWLFAALRDESTPFPVLALIGGQGSAKSYNARILRNLIDPNAAPLRTFPKDETDLLIAARSGHVVTMENISANGFKDWLSDAICRLATGGGLSKRAQYTDADEFVLPDTRRPVLLTSIDYFIRRQDLLDRTFIVGLPSIADSNRKLESDLLEEFTRRHPSILGALFDGVSYALAEAYRPPPPDLPRLADAAKWIHGAELALGALEQGKFLTVFREHYLETVERGLNQTDLYRVIDAFLFNRRKSGVESWTGTMEELLVELRMTYVDGDLPKLPPDATRLSSALNRIDAALRKVGVDFVSLPRNEKRREIILSRSNS